MAAIDQYLANIMSAVYGRDVRSSIHDAIQQSYADANDVVKVSSTQPTEENVKLWVKPEADEFKVPTYSEFEDLAESRLTIPELPEEDGRYYLVCNISNGEPTYSWESMDNGESDESDDPVE